MFILTSLPPQNICLFDRNVKVNFKPFERLFFQSVTQGAEKKKCLFLGTVLKDTPQKADDTHEATFLVHCCICAV